MGSTANLFIRNVMEFQNYIDGKWVKGKGGASFDTINPANEEVLAQIQEFEDDHALCNDDILSSIYQEWFEELMNDR